MRLHKNVVSTFVLIWCVLCPMVLYLLLLFSWPVWKYYVAVSLFVMSIVLLFPLGYHVSEQCDCCDPGLY